MREPAAYEGLLDQVRASESDVPPDGFGKEPNFRSLVELNGKAVGFAVSFHNHSTFEGRPGLYLEDISLAEKARAQNPCRPLRARLAAIALEAGGGRLDLSVLRENPARGVCHRLGLAETAD